MRVFNIIFLSLLATIFFSAGLLLGLPGDFAIRALWITIFIPIIWSAFIFYCSWDKKNWRSATVLTLTSVAGMAIVVLVPAPI